MSGRAEGFWRTFWGRTLVKALLFVCFFVIAAWVVSFVVVLSGGRQGRIGLDERVTKREEKD